MMWRRTMHKTAGEIGRSTTPSGRNKKTEEEEHKCRLRENLWDEFLIRSSRPRPPMFMPKSPIEQQKRQEQFHKKYYNQPKSSITSSPLFVGHSLEEPSPAELAKLLKVLNEKEQDLQLAAKLGNSLLQENKELQEKNQFLEESLASSEETVAQLQKTLQQRSKLFHTIIDLENEHEELGHKQEGLDLKSEELLRLERQLKQVENENKELRMKNKHLDELKALVEKREEQRISEQMSQLRGANLKIAQLQVQLNEKGHQCETQADEVQRLLKEIAQRKTREKMLWNENDDIKAQLDEALLSHEQLRHEMEQLQERHTDLISMLKETEDELRMHREKALAPPPRRTNSTDSLYDSLASELEGADSGCYNTPMFSARYGPSPHGSSLSGGGDQQPTCSASAITNSNQQGMEPILERTLIADDVVENNKGNDQQNHRQQQSFDVPSRALLEVVRSTFEDRRKFRQMSPTRQQQRNLQQLQKFAEHRRRTVSQLSHENGVEKNDGVEADLSTPIATNKTIGGHIKSFKDAACSPIHFTKNDVESSAPPSSRNLVAFSSSSAESVDSLDDYNPPKLGAPGRPGTKDLDFSIKRLNLWKWTEFVCSAVSSPSKENSMPSSKSMPFSNSMPISEMLTINTSAGILQRCDHQINDEIMSPSTENSMPISEMLTTMRSSASTGILQRCDQLNGC